VNGAGVMAVSLPGRAAKEAAVMRLPVSCFVIAKDEEDRLPYTLESVQGWAGEIVVAVDASTSDATAEVAMRFGARVVTREWEGYGPQKRYAESLCVFPWLLNLDADESVSPELRAEIVALFDRYDMDPPFDGFRLNVRTLRPGQDVPSPLAPSNSPVRLYRRDAACFRDSPVHDSVVFRSPSPRIGMLSAPVCHRCFRSYAHAVEKINFYSSMQAEDMFAKGKSCGLRILFEPFLAFFKAYFLRRYLFLGTDGFVESVIYAFARTLRLAKLRELRRLRGKT
jgi:glycosyltransferase involved in cell wall biosynthesis